MELTDAHAKSLVNCLKEPIKIMTRKDAKKQYKKSLFYAWKHTVFAWYFSQFYNVKREAITKNVQVLEFNMPSLLAKVKNLHLYEELLLQKVVLKWVPYISSNMSGRTTVLLCDLRSFNAQNIIKGGYTFSTSKMVDDLLIAPGYLVNLKDPNLASVFKFIVFTSNLDLAEDSYYGNLELALDFKLGKRHMKAYSAEGHITLVSGDDTLTVAQNEPVLLPEILENIDVNDIIASFTQINKDKAEVSKARITNVSDLIQKPTASRILDILNRSSSSSLSVGEIEPGSSSNDSFKNAVPVIQNPNDMTEKVRNLQRSSSLRIPEARPIRGNFIVPEIKESGMRRSTSDVPTFTISAQAFNELVWKETLKRAKEQPAIKENMSQLKEDGQSSESDV